MIPHLLASWTLPLGLQTGGYFLYLALVIAGSWHWWRKRPEGAAGVSAHDDGELPPDELD